MQPLGRLAFRRQVTGAPDLAVAPGADLLQLADGAVADHFAHSIKIAVGMALRADLRGQFVLVLEPGGANHPGFLHAVGQRLFQ